MSLQFTQVSILLLHNTIFPHVELNESEYYKLDVVEMI